jgi:CubicO group peptidase (beta-lactamase class C family)
MLRTLASLAVALGVSWVAPALYAQPDHAVVDAAPAWQATVDQAVRDEMQRQELVGVAIGVIREGRVVYTAGYGMADRENDVPVTGDTLFRWGSISKPVTAIAAMQLVETDALDLSADVRDYVPEFPDHGASMTGEHLLAHLSGIVHYRNGRVVRAQRAYDTPHPYESVILALDTFAPSPLVSQPGEQYNYSTHAYILASAAVERAGRGTFWEQVRERICEPLGLTTLQPDYQWVDIPNRAVGYRTVGDGVFRSTDSDVSWKLGGGGFISNVHDLARFAAALMNHELVSEESSRDMWTPRTDAAGEGTSYGLGLGVSGQGRGLKVEHSGAQEKARTRMVIYPNQRHGVVVMTNSEHGDCGALSTAIHRAINADRAQNLESVGP